MEINDYVYWRSPNYLVTGRGIFDADGQPVEGFDEAYIVRHRGIPAQLILKYWDRQIVESEYYGTRDIAIP